MLQSMRAIAKYIWWLVAASFILVFVLLDQSGLLGNKPTASSNVAVVNGTSITYLAYENEVRLQQQQESQRTGRVLNADEDRQLAQQVFDRMVTDALLQQDFKRRGIIVTDDEIRQAAMDQPYEPLARSPEFQTEGRFDFQKYQRFLASPIAREQGILAQLESYYRDALYKSKLYTAIATSVYATDAQLWRLWRDTHDSARVTYVALSADAIPDSAVHVSESEIAAYFEAHRKELKDLPGRAVLRAARLPRTITAADTARARAKALALRAEIEKGEKFEDVARRESADTASATQGGALGIAGRGSYVPAFEQALYSLPIGVVSQPVLTQFGYHLIRVDARKGDSVTAHHILVPIAQSDSTASITDHEADELATASGTSRPMLFDSITKKLGLQTGEVVAIEGSGATWDGHYLPGASAWAFQGAKPGDVGELLDAPDAYYLVRLDSLDEGGKPTLDKLRDQIRAQLAREKKLDLLMPKAHQVAAAAAAAPSFEKAVRAAGYVPLTTPDFARTSQVPGIGQGNEAIGAAFGLPLNKVGEPAKARTAVVIERVDARRSADSAAWAKQVTVQRSQMQQRIHEQLVQQYVENLRLNAKIVDNRKAIQAASRETGG